MKIKKEKIKEIAVKAVLIIARHAFFACLILFLAALTIGTFIFNDINNLKNITEFEDLEDSFFLNNKVYQRVLNNWQRDGDRFQEADFREYIDPFFQEEID